MSNSVSENTASPGPSSCKMPGPGDQAQSPAALHQISQQNATRSPLLRLPAEIRIMVFGYVFQDEDYYTGSGYPIYSMQEHPSLRRDLGLLLFSRQLYREAASLPYKLAVFRLDFHRYHDLWEFFVGKVKGADWSHGSSRMLR